jgi:MFS family permease
MKTKRLSIATILGAAFGFVCCGMASSGENEISTILAANIILGRTLIGFGIGISRFSFKHWSLHGTIMGLIFGLPAAFGAMLGPENPEFTHTLLFVSTIVMGMIYGFLIELITSVVFKARQ